MIKNDNLSDLVEARPEGQMTFKDKVKAAQTAYLSIPAGLGKGRESELLAQVRAYFPHLRVSAYQSEFGDSAAWRNGFSAFIDGVDALIIGCDSSRLVGAGIRREIINAKAAGKLILVFKFDDNQMRRYHGYCPVEGKRGMFQLKKPPARQA
jgi:hypothetical protein